VLAVAVLLAYGPWLRDTVLIILIAYVAKFWALGHRPIAGSADAISPELFGAARISGAGAITAVRTITVPLLRPALAAAWLIVFMFALHEITISSLLYGPGSATLAVTVLNLRQLGDPTVTAALAVLLTVGVVVSAIPIVAMSRRWGVTR
jgi:iron(III) transport system permease protein